MSRRVRRIVTLAVVLATISVRAAAADPAPVNLHLQTPFHVVTAGGSALDLPPGYFVDEATRAALDVEMKRLQTVEVKLTAENGSMRTSLAAWQPGFYTLAIAIVSSVVLGVYLDRKL